jgi:hypothetical protein
LDYFLLQHELRSGKTVVECFVANRPDLPEHERELLLGWRDVVEGIFEVHGRDGNATERMQSFFTFCRDQAVAGLVASGKQPKNLPLHAPDYPADLVASDAVAITHDEVDGMGLHADFGLIEEAFADPGLLRHPEYRRRVRDYLDDPSVSPLLFERMAARDPERTNQVFRKLLGNKHFDWALGGEKLMRRRKPDYFDRPRLPRVVPLSDKLARYAASA